MYFCLQVYVRRVLCGEGANVLADALQVIAECNGSVYIRSTISVKTHDYNSPWFLSRN